MKNDFPAFPVEQSEMQDGGWNQSFSGGMMMTDYFAAVALQGFLAASKDAVHDPKLYAHLAYEQAAEMIAAREASCGEV